MAAATAPLRKGARGVWEEGERVRIRVHPLAPMLLPLGHALGLREELIAALLALALHEAAHLLAARIANARLKEFDVLPFGASIRLENLYGLSVAQQVVVALAGPAANALGVLLGAALAWWGLLKPEAMLYWVRANCMLGAFNLLPALPLDGGRALYGALSGKLGRSAALNLGIWMGRALAAALVAATIAGFLHTGRLNVLLIFIAIFLIAAGEKEREEAREGRALALIRRMRSVRSGTRVRAYAMDWREPALSAVRLLRAREETIFLVYREGKWIGTVDAEAISQVLLRGVSAGEITMGEIARPRDIPEARALPADSMDR